MKKLVYLISPNKIDQSFLASLDKVLSAKNVKFFQLRLKNLSQKKLLNFSKRIIKITSKHKVKFIINDNFILASKIKYLVSHVTTQKNLQLTQLKIMQVILLLDLFLNPNLSKIQ